MAGFDFGFGQYEDEENEEEMEFDPQIRWGTRDGLILLIDCSKFMFDETGEEECLFQLCVKVAKTTLQNKIISSDKDLVGIVFFGTEKSKNPNDFKHIYIYQELDQPGAPRILELEEMVEKNYKKFGKEFGHSTGYSLNDALWTCQNMFANSSQKVNYKRIMLFTNNDNPHAGSQQLQRQARAKANDLHETGIDLELMHLQNPGQNFDIKKFYKDLLYADDDELTELPDPAERLEELLTRVRSKDHKKRAVRRIPLSLGPGVNLSVGVYTLVRPCPKPYPVKLSKKDNEGLKSHTKTYLKDTGEVLMPQDLKKAQTYGGKRICFENDEVTEIKRFEEPGLYLMGFKPRSCLKKHYHVKPAQFIYPDETSIIGSTTMFTALLKKCLERDVFPFCKYIGGKNYPPRFVALLPQICNPGRKMHCQHEGSRTGVDRYASTISKGISATVHESNIKEEEVDEHKVQITPPGFHVIYFPFADDFRKVTLENMPRANAEQIDKAKEMIKKLQFPFSSENFESPILQKYWRNIEALALDRDIQEEMIDYTLPDVERMEKKAGKEIQNFKDQVFPDGYTPGAKHKAGDNAAAKKARMEQAANLIDAETEAKAGRLGKLTVAVLKEIIKREGITSSSSKKADLIDVISAHYGVV